MQNTEKILRCLMRVADRPSLASLTLVTGATVFQIAVGSRPCRFPSACRIIGTIRPISIGVPSKTLICCAKNKIRVLERAVMTGNRQVKHLPNLLGSLAFYRVG